VGTSPRPRTLRGLDSSLAPGLGEAQRRLLGEIKHRGEATIFELAVTGLARETIRDHLKALEAFRLVQRAGLRRAGRGRPEVVYRLSPAGNRLFPQRHGQLLRELVEFLNAGGRHEVLEEFFEARNRRKHEALFPRVLDLEGSERVQEVAAILSEEGFVADAWEESGAERLRLCHCPWRELVAVSRAPCRAEMSLVSELLGQRLTREAFIPAGDLTCTYCVGTAADDPPQPPGL